MESQSKVDSEPALRWLSPLERSCLMVRFLFRDSFGKEDYIKYGLIGDRHLTPLIHGYSDYVNYPKGNRTLSGHRGFVIALTLSDDGRCLFTSSMDFSIICWDLEKCAIRNQWELEQGFARGLAYQHGLLVSFNDSGEISVWNGINNQLMRTLKACVVEESDFELSKDESSEAEGNNSDGSDAPEGSSNEEDAGDEDDTEPEEESEMDGEDGDEDSDEEEDNDEGSNKNEKANDSPVEFDPFIETEEIWCMDSYPTQSPTIATGSHDRTVRLRSLNNGDTLRLMRGHKSMINCVIFVYLSTLISGSDDGSIREWDLINGECRKVTKSKDAVRSLCLNCDHSLLLCVFDSHTLIYEWPGMSNPKTIVDHGSGPAQFHPQNQYYFAQCCDLTVRLFNAETRECIHTFDPGLSKDAFLDLRFTPDGSHLIAICEDKLIYIWDLSHV